MKSLRNRVLLALGIAVTLGFVVVGYVYTSNQEKVIIDDYQRSIHKVTESVSQALHSVMLEDHAEIMRDYARRLKSLKDVTDFVIIRADGSEAFRDAETVRRVNDRLGSEEFQVPVREKRSQVIDPSDPLFSSILAESKEALIESRNDKGERQLIFYDPIPNRGACHRCHGKTEEVRGVFRVTSLMTGVEKAVLRVRIQSILLMGGALLVTMLFTGYMLGRTVVQPIESITNAMMNIASGNFALALTPGGGKEIHHMAESFNRMTSNLKEGYELLMREKEKLITVILAAREAIIVTDAMGEIVLVNPAATELLGKSEETIRQEGFAALFEDSDLMARLLKGAGRNGHNEVVGYRDRIVQVSAATIDDGEERIIGTAALIRDVTEEKRMIEELRRIAITDALTGVYNRRHLDATLKSEFERARRGNRTFSVLLFDVDHFKKFNDTYGHDQGDRVLRAIGVAMRVVARKYDTPCRYGGEEFVMILPEADEQGSVSAGERLRKEVEDMVVDGLRVTISLGAANYPTLAAETPEQLIEAADAALYKSKEGGRNRLTVADGSCIDKAKG